MILNPMCYVSQVGRDSRVVLSWQLALEDNISDYDINIFRGETPQTLEAIGGGLNASKYRAFIDITPKMLNVHQEYHYAIQLVRVRNTTLERPYGQVFKTEPFTWEGARDTVTEFIIGEHNFLFRWVSGVPIAVLHQKHDAKGVRCTACWNPILKKITRSNCTTCYGTGFEQGYYTPIYAWADLSSQQQVNQIVEWGVKQPSQYDLMFSDYPRLTPNDIVIELVSGKRWKVTNAKDMEKRRMPMLQFVRLDLINTSDIEYSIPIDEDLKRLALKEYEDVKRQKLSY